VIFTIKSEHLFKEVESIKEVAEKLESDGELFESNMLKAQTLMIKLLLNIRQNQVAIMNEQGVKLIRPRSRNEEEPKQ
jgi:hypothetical protein